MAGGYSNPVTGLGMSGTDSRLASTFTAGYITDEMAAEMWRGDAIAQKIVSMLPKEALEPGVSLTVQDEQRTVGGQVDTRAAGDLVEDVERMHRELGTEAIIKRACEWERLFGGAAIWAGANDHQASSWAAPLNLEAPMLSVRWLDVLRSRDLTPVSIYTDPLHPKYGKVEVWRLSRVIGSGRLHQYAEIHESRLFLFRGSRIVDDGTVITQNMQSTEFGDGIMIAVQGALRRFQEALDNTEHAMRANGELLWQHNRLSEILANEGEDDFRKLVAAMSYASSILRARVVGSDQTLTRQSISLAGLADVVTKFENELAALSGIPRTKLFGEAPGGLGNNAQGPHGDWDETKATYRKDHQLPAYEWVTKLAFRSLGGEPRRWKLEGNPYRHPTEQEKGAIVQLEANTDIALSQAGIVTQEEVRARTIWRDRYALPDPQEAAPELGAMPDDIRDPAALPAGELGQDPAAAEESAPASEAPKAADLALNGAQALALSAIIEKVAAGIIPRASGAQLVQFGFKVPPDQAEAMMPSPDFRPAAASPGVTSEPKPEPIPSRTDADEERTIDTLLKKLSPSGKCSECGEKHPLEVDHVNGRSWDPAELSAQQRADKYWQEYERGTKLRALCRSCNGRDGAKNKQGKSGPAHRGDEEVARDDAHTADEAAEVIEHLREYQYRALLGEDRDALAASLELLMDVPCEMAERLIPSGPSPGWTPPPEEDVDDEDGERNDCENPIRVEGGLFDGCAPGDGPGSSTTTAKKSTAPKAAAKAKPAAKKPAAKKLTPKQKAAAKAKLVRQKKAERAKKLRENKRAALDKKRQKAAEKRAKAKEVAAKRKAAAAEKRKAAAEKKRKQQEAKAQAKAKKAETKTKTKTKTASPVASDPATPPAAPKAKEQAAAPVAEPKAAPSAPPAAAAPAQAPKQQPQRASAASSSGASNIDAPTMAKLRSSHAASRTPDQAAAEIVYSGMSAFAINKKLRSGSVPDGSLGKTVQDLDASIASASPLERDTTLYRAIDPSGAAHMMQLKPGDVYQDKGYVSTTASKDYLATANAEMHLVINARAGSRAAPIASKHPHEDEMLLARGGRFRVEKVETGLTQKVLYKDMDGKESMVDKPLTLLHVTLLGDDE